MISGHQGSIDRCLVFAAVRTFVCVMCLGAAATAVAQVTLANSVHKVVTGNVGGGDAQRRFVEAENVVAGDELRHTITFANKGGAIVDAGSIVITNPISAGTEYLEGTARGAATEILFSVDGDNFAGPEDLMVSRGGALIPASAADYASIRWAFQPELAPGESGAVSFNVRLK
jgi:uncharacterized repeat protein (TIGR01451 family)